MSDEALVMMTRPHRLASLPLLLGIIGCPREELRYPTCTTVEAWEAASTEEESTRSADVDCVDAPGAWVTEEEACELPVGVVHVRVFQTVIDGCTETAWRYLDLDSQTQEACGDGYAGVHLVACSDRPYYK